MNFYYSFAVGVPILIGLFLLVLLVAWGPANTLERAGIWMLQHAAWLRAGQREREKKHADLLDALFATEATE